MTTINIKIVADKRVFDETGRLVENICTVPKNEYWARRLRDGDVEVLADSKSTSHSDDSQELREQTINNDGDNKLKKKVK